MSQRSLALVCLLILVTLAGHARGQTQGAGNPARGRTDQVVARVQGEPIRLSEIEARKDHNMESYAKATGRAVPGDYDLFFLRSATEEAVRDRLVRLDGQAQGLKASDAAAESLMKRDPSFQSNGRFDPARFEAFRTGDPKAFQEVKRQAKQFLVLQQSIRALERRFDPDPATLDALWRARASRVRVRYTLISEAHYDGETDPTDAELEAYYRRTKDDFARASGDSLPKVAPPLVDVAVDVRSRWRVEALGGRKEAEARAYYEAHPDSFATRAWNVRWATVDSARVTSRSPSDKELAAWYEAHRNEFARLDPGGSGIQTIPYEEARAQVRARWQEEQVVVEGRRLADDLAVAWSKGKDAKPKSDAVRIGGPAWLVEGGALPQGLTAELADSARALTPGRRAQVMKIPGGYSVVGLVKYSDRERVPFETVRSQIEARLESERAAKDKAAARAWFDSHRDRYQTGPGYAIAYATSVPPSSARIDIPGSTLERYYREHRSEFATPAEVHVRHILISTEGRSKAQAEALARTLLDRIRKGESFTTLAAENSEDPGSRERGGDLGFIRAGQTSPAFEKVAFALTAAHPLGGPVQTEYGYHVIELLDRKEATMPPFADVRAEIGAKLAEQYADTLARTGAEDLRRAAKDYDDLIRLATDRKMSTALVRWYDGLALSGPSTVDEVRGDAPGVAPRTLFPRVYRYLNLGYVVIALDSIMPSRPLEFEEVGDRVVSDWKRDRRLAAVHARADRAEADLMKGEPWSEAFETVGGVVETKPIARGEGLPTVGSVAPLDSLLFGPGPDTLAVGKWARVPTARGDLFLTVIERIPPDTKDAAAERERLRALLINRRVYEYVETLRSRYSVEVLRPDLAERIPAPPAI